MIKLMRQIFFGLILLGCIAGCVPTKRLVYLQPEGGLKAEHAYDSMLASYSLRKETYKLKPEDVISLRIASITEDRYNFIKQYEEDLGVIRTLNQYSQGLIEGNDANGNQNLRNLGGGGGGGNNQGEEGPGVSPLLLDRMNTGFILDLNGELELPDIGKLKLGGLTIPESEKLVRDSLDGFFETPMVRIQLLNYHFTIVGEVNNEGRYLSFDPDMNIFDAITLAGNLTEFADRANIKIVRTEGETSKVYYLNTLDEKTLNASSYFIRRGDLIIVPPLSARTGNMYTLPNIVRTLSVVSAALSVAAFIISVSR